MIIGKGFQTLFYREYLRFRKVALQTIVAPVITTLLYLVVFSQALQEHVVVFNDVSYASFLVPGLILMAVMQNAFANSSSSIIQSKITGNIIYMLLPPLSYLEFYLAYLLAAMLRAIIVGIGVFIVAAFIIPLRLEHFMLLLLFALLSSAVLATLGILAGIWADKFDQLSGFQNFVIMPLSFLSGVFYSIQALPEFWQNLSMFNPFFYMVDGFRYCFFGQSDYNPMLSLLYITLFFVSLAALTLQLLRSGYKLRQ